MIPELTKQCIDAYVKDGVPLGDFLTAVMANDLMEAFGRADENNRYHMFDIICYVYNRCPSLCHGSYEIVDEWIKRKREGREKDIQE